MLSSVPDLVSLPGILKWELSLALLVLVWSLVSLARARDWSLRGRGRAANVVSLQERRRLHEARRARAHPLRAVVVAAAFAVVAGSFAFALPSVIKVARPGRGSLAGAAEGAVSEGRRSTGGSAGEAAASFESGEEQAMSPGGASGSGVRPGEITRRGAVGAERGGAPIPSRAGSPAPPALTPDATPSAQPSPTPTIEPSPSPSPTEPTPTPTVSPEDGPPGP